MTTKEICSGLSRPLVVSALTLLLVASSSAAGHETVLHVFQGKPGEHPVGGLVSDPAGNLYGTTTEGPKGGACSGGYPGCGVVFRLTRDSTGWSYSVIYKFKGVPDGQYPTGNLIFDAAGNLYGTTLYGGSAGAGSVFEVTPTSGRGWTESTLYSFQGGTDGAFPVGTIVFDTAGNLYGVTENGGTGCDFSCGTVFELSPGSGGWSEKVLYSFQGQLQNPDAAYPTGGLIIDSSGNLYGATAGGGAKRCSGSFGGCGTIFELSRVSGGWVESVLYPFQGGSDGQEAMGVVLDPSGNLFGTTQEGGSQANCGTVFKLTPHAGGKWTNNVLHRFTCGNDGGAPAAGVVLDAGGNVYGTAQVGGTYGTVFKLALVSGGKWAFRVLHGFTGNRDGGDPEGSVILDATGTHLYGTTNLAGDAHYFSGLGMVFEITP